jgi:hypothetical protein
MSIAGADVDLGRIRTTTSWIRLFHDDMEGTMAVCMGCDEERTLVGRNESQMDAVVRRMLRDSARRRESDRRVGERAARNSGLGRGEGRYERLEAITVRTAARVLQLQRAGVVTAREARFYLRELVAMDAHAGPGAAPRPGPHGAALPAARSGEPR